MPFPLFLPAPLRAASAAVALVLAASFLAGCGSTSATGDKGYVDGQGVITVLAPGKRRPVGPITGSTLQGKPVSLSSLARGRPVVVNVWASWCAPCRAEARRLSAAARALGTRAAFLGINVRDPGGTDRSLAYERSFAVPYSSLYDPSGRTLLAFPGGVTPYSIPSTLVIDAQGRVAASVLGALPTAQTLVDLVKGAR